MVYENTLRCRMAEKSGDGCAAVLYKAAGTRLHRFVARKFLHQQEVCKEPKAPACFRRQTSAWNHPNVNPGRGGIA
jgi:hypothetical protein